MLSISAITDKSQQLSISPKLGGSLLSDIKQHRHVLQGWTSIRNDFLTNQILTSSWGLISVDVVPPTSDPKDYVKSTQALYIKALMVRSKITDVSISEPLRNMNILYTENNSMLTNIVREISHYMENGWVAVSDKRITVDDAVSNSDTKMLIIQISQQNDYDAKRYPIEKITSSRTTYAIAPKFMYVFPGGGITTNKDGSNQEELLEITGTKMRTATHVYEVKSTEMSKAISVAAGAGDLSQSSTCITYLYQDPVVRMICESTAMVLRQYAKDARLLDWKTISKKEGAMCVFGVGAIDCCRTAIADVIREIMCNEDRRSKEFASDLKSQIERGIRGLTGITNAQYSTGKQQLDEGNSQLFPSDKKSLMGHLCTIYRLIIDKSGRSEGSLPNGAKRKKYPVVSPFEVLDPSNTAWIMRCERYHLNNSPCVHTGMYTQNNVSVVDQWQEVIKFDSSVYLYHYWIHSLAHAFDRLYCGHCHSLKTKKDMFVYNKPHESVWRELMNSLDVMASIGMKNNADAEYTDGKTLFEYLRKKNVINTEFGFSKHGNIENQCNIRVEGYQCNFKKSKWEGNEWDYANWKKKYESGMPGYVKHYLKWKEEYDEYLDKSGLSDLI